VAVFVTILFLAGTAEAASTAPTRTESSLLTAMNEARRANGLLPLRADGRLERAARGHSAEMLRTGTFFHGSFSARIRGAGVRAPRVGENLAWGVGALSLARAIVNKWLNSPSHRANLLRPGYRIVGVGALRGTYSGHRGALVVTTDFAGR
jgi:uncharacterized protein YkwD